ncbi:MAG: (deoxy)nucleoside triphosphate pyrophosphohydrolase [Anaerovoracaceae bacterium]|nr:(deoxy)nucleoside triphosphate pyrophosphohydrolase [Clostridiales bacterium]
MVFVVAALIWDNDKFMICQRPKDKARPLLWEFAGGKVDKGETKEEALKRELKEELDIEVKVMDVFTSVVHKYDDITINLTVFNTQIIKGVPKKIEHNDIRWIKVDEIKDYDFCPADKNILKEISNESNKL